MERRQYLSVINFRCTKCRPAWPCWCRGTCTRYWCPLEQLIGSKPLDNGANKPFKSYYREGHHTWRSSHFDVSLSDVTKKSYSKKTSRQHFIDFVSAAWSKVSPACVKKAFEGARIIAPDPALSGEPSTDVIMVENSDWIIFTFWHISFRKGIVWNSLLLEEGRFVLVGHRKTSFSNRRVLTTDLRHMYQRYQGILVPIPDD